MKFKLKEAYLLILIVLGLVSLSVYSTYALFTKEVTIDNVVSFNATLSLSDSNLVEYELVTLNPNETKIIELRVSNSSTSTLYYGCWYETLSNNPDITIGMYLEKSNVQSTGTLATTETKTLVVGIVNNSASTTLVNLGVVGSATENLGLSSSRIIITDTFSPAIIVTDEVLAANTTTTTENVNLEYTTPQKYEITLYSGIYLLETWGAQGADNTYVYTDYDKEKQTTYNSYGGKGGYSKGTLTLTEKTTAYIYSGGQGSHDNQIDSSYYSGGFNGGGTGTAMYTPGGGASDVRLGADSLYARVIVAGGGGGSGMSYGSKMYHTGEGGSGGGTSGIAGKRIWWGLNPSYNYPGGGGGTQTEGGTAGKDSNTHYANAGYFGNGGSGRDGYGQSGGGGGWYGGGSSYKSTGGGGSGYVYTADTATNYPTGCLLNSTYYLTDAETIAGDTSFTDFDGSTVTGHSGNGAVRISGTSQKEVYSIPRILNLNNVTVLLGKSVSLTEGVTYECETVSTNCKYIGPNISDTSQLNVGLNIIQYKIKSSNNEMYVYERKVNVIDNSKIDSSGANFPELTDALIPVVYDESTSSWVKADVTSSKSTYGWYDYDQKKWANAVLVKKMKIGYNSIEKNVSISNNSDITSYISNNKGIDSSKAKTVITIKTGNTTGTLSFAYKVSSESSYDKMYIIINDGSSTTTIADGISGTPSSSTYRTDATANTTYTITLRYEKDGSVNANDDQAMIYDIVVPSGSVISSVGKDTANSYDYEFTANTTVSNSIGSSFTYDNTSNKYILDDITNVPISSNIVGKYICEDITKTECTKMYEITDASTNITKVKEYTSSSINTYEAREYYLNSSAGTTIADTDILAFYVWIPRYKYKVWNINKVIGTDSYNAQTTGIDIVFEDSISSTGTISCTYSYAEPSSSAGSPNETCTGNNGDYYTHPAFTFGNQELTGFWMGKFELSSISPTTTADAGELALRILPNVTSWSGNSVSNFWKVIYDMQTANNVYGLSTSRVNVDSHSITNMEWGAVAYLTNSKYGRCTNGSCIEVTKNNCSTYKTGIGGDTVSANSSSTTCTTDVNKYNAAKGMLASTTGNIYGIYDMSGGSLESVMGSTSKSNGTTFIYNAINAGSNFTYTENTAKYLTPYSNGETTGDQEAYNRARLGDATGEVVLASGEYSGTAWYGDVAQLASGGWFIRGGASTYSAGSGIFCLDSSSGTYADRTFSTRATLTVFP